MDYQVTHEQICVQQAVMFSIWTHKWPAYCTACGAWGSWHSAGSFNDPPDGGPCNECIALAICPRCASTNLEAIEVQYCDYFRCLECGWDEQTIIGSPFDHDMVCPIWEDYCYADYQAVDQWFYERDLPCPLSQSEMDKIVSIIRSDGYKTMTQLLERYINV